MALTVTDRQSETVCRAADAVLVTSGTATLEVALCKRPMVISYKISPLTYAYVKRKIKVPHVGLPNILLGKEAVPELLQSEAKPEKLAAALADWYEHPDKVAALQQDFGALHLLLKKIRRIWPRVRFWKRRDVERLMDYFPEAARITKKGRNCD